MKIIRAVGIDLGTTNSAVGVLSPRGDEIELLEDRFKRKTFPSMVGWDPDVERFITCWEAWNRRELDPPPVASIKRKMGTQQTVNVGEHALLPEEISAKILSRLGDEASRFMDAKFEDDDHDYLVQRAVITIPAYFDAQQIEATRQAGELAGLEVVGMLQEPTAAAMYYAWKHGIGDGNFLVYDLGGGTFDVSVIRCLMGEYQVLGIDGDNFLGGDDFDKRVAEYLRSHLVEQGYVLDLDIVNHDDDRTRFMLLQRLGQEIKESLSQSDVQYVGRRNLFKDQEGNSVSLDLEISREQFEEIIADLVNETIACCERALLKSATAADVTLAEIDHVLLVGGSTRVPMIQRRVAESFCGDSRSRASRPQLDEPDTCVALGAAIHAANVAGLSFIDEDTTEDPAHLNLTTTLSTQGTTIRLAGHLATPHWRLVDSVVLIDNIGEIAAITRPEPRDENLFFNVEDIATPDPGRYGFSLEFCDDEGDALAAFSLLVERVDPSRTLRSTGSALSNPSVLAKDIYLEVVRDGRPTRQILLPSGTSLPADGKFKFHTADDSGAVILRLFQNRFPIRTIHLTVPEDTSVGTQVDLNLSIDEAMSMVASGEISGQTFWAQIEAPPARELKNWAQIEELLGRVDRVNRELWGYESRYFRERTDQLIAGIHETARTDPDKLQVLVARLEEIVDDYHERDKALTPGHGRYVALLDAIKRVVWRGDDKLKLGLDQEEWRGRLAKLEEQAEEAFQNHDQTSWSRLFNQVQAIWESLAQDEHRFTKSDPKEYVERLTVSVNERVSELYEHFEEFSLSANPETKMLQEARLRELREELKARIESPLRQLDVGRLGPGPARQELEKLTETLQYLERQLDKLPTIGLVRK